jgi:hypothetical protein
MSPEEKQYLDARRMASTYDDECPPTVRNDDRKTEPMASPFPLCKCGGPGTATHECPYNEIEGTETCNCCESCSEVCAREI